MLQTLTASYQETFTIGALPSPLYGWVSARWLNSHSVIGRTPTNKASSGGSRFRNASCLSLVSQTCSPLGGMGNMCRALSSGRLMLDSSQRHRASKKLSIDEPSPERHAKSSKNTVKSSKNTAKAILGRPKERAY